MQKKAIFVIACAMSLLAYVSDIFSADLAEIKLPAPQTQGGKPLMQALSERKTARAFSPRELSAQTLSDLLWAACGINRPGSGGRTAPTAMNMQEIDVYVVKADGLYLYDPKAHVLLPLVAGDLRALAGKQDFVARAPVNLIYVADLSRTKGEVSDGEFYSAVDTGYISQNVYLYCASSGLATVARGFIDKPALAKAMKLNPKQRIILAQTVGYPAP